MRINVTTFWDEEASVWCGLAEGGIGLVTEATTLDEMYRKLPVIAQDLLEGDFAGDVEIVMIVLDRIPGDT